MPKDVCGLAGGFVVKYGSLVIDLPFSPDAVAAVTMVLSPPIAYSIYLLRRND